MKFILGTDPQGQSVCPERSNFQDHATLYGNPGSGKSQMMLSLMKQAILHPDPDVQLVVYIDMKALGDPVARNWLAQNVPAGWQFLYFTTNEAEESDTYNALDSIMRRFKIPSTQTDALCGRLGISHSYKETFFEHNNIALCQETLQKHPNPASFDELHKNLERVRDANGDRYKHATDILNRVRVLAASPRLADQRGTKAIEVPKLYEQPTILCVSLPVMEGTTMPQLIGKFLLSDLVLEAKGRKALLFCDESHHLFDSRATLLVAEQSRGFGVGIVMAAQSSEQYKTEDGRPLDWIVDKLASVKMQFSPNTPDDLKKIMVLSGQKDTTKKSYTRTQRPDYAFWPSVTESFTDSEGKEFNLNLNDILNHLKRPGAFVLQIDHDEDYGSPTLVTMAWPLIKNEYERLRKWPWPAPSVPSAPTPPLAPPTPVQLPSPPCSKSEALKDCEKTAITPPKKKSSRRKKKT